MVTYTYISMYARTKRFYKERFFFCFFPRFVWKRAVQLMFRWKLLLTYAWLKLVQTIQVYLETKVKH